MKKLLLLIAGVVFVSGVALADGNYYPALVVSSVTNQGFLYTTSSNTAGGFLVGNAAGVFDWTNKPITATSTGTAAQFFPAFPSLTTTMLTALAPINAGQMVFCNNCAASPVCISSGTGVGAWVVVGTSNTFAGGPFACK